MIEKMTEASRIEDSIFALSQPALPAREIFGNLLTKMNLPEAAKEQYEQTLLRTPRRPKSIFGIARGVDDVSLLEQVSSGS